MKKVLVFRIFSSVIQKPKETRKIENMSKNAKNVAVSFGTASIEYLTSMISAWTVGQGKNLTPKDQKAIKEFAVGQVRGSSVKEEPQDDSEEAETKPGKGQKAGKADSEEKVFILLNSTAKNHGVFPHPSLAKAVQEILDESEAGHTSTKIGRKFQGFAFPQDHLSLVKKSLGKKFDVEEVEFEGFTDPWAQAAPKKMVSGKAGKAAVGKGKPAKATKVEKAADVKLVKNKWGNLWDSKSKMVFVKFQNEDEETVLALLGRQNEKAKVDAKSKEEPFSTITKVEEEDLPEIPGLDFKFLTNELAHTCADEKLFARFYEADILIKDPSEDEGTEDEGDEKEFKSAAGEEEEEEEEEKPKKGKPAKADKAKGKQQKKVDVSEETE